MGLLDIFRKKGKSKPYQQPEPRLKSEKTASIKPEAPEKPTKETTPVQKTKEVKKEVKKDGGDAHKTLVRHIVTEKSTRLQEKSNQYTFEVTSHTNKVEIRKALQALYGVTVEKITILNKAGKYGRFGAYYGQQKARKKAIVGLKKGDKITL